MKCEKIEPLLGKKVVVTFYDKSTETGILTRGYIFFGELLYKRYYVKPEGSSFLPSHIIKIKEVKENEI